MGFPAFDLSSFEQAEGAERQALAEKLDQICRETEHYRVTKSFLAKPHAYIDDLLAEDEEE